MPLTWAQVQAKPEFQHLSPPEQEKARQQYFEEVIIPQIPPDAVDQVRSQFDADTRPKRTPLQKAEAESSPKSWVDRFLPSGDEWKRQAGLGARTVIEAAASPFAMAADALALPYDVAALFTGAPQIQENNQWISDMLTHLGLPEPQSTLEKGTNLLAGGVMGGGIQSRLAKGAAEVSKSPQTKSFFQGLAGDKLPTPSEVVRRPAAVEARGAGFKMPPSSLRETWTNRLLDELIDTRRGISAENQQMVNDLARREIGAKGPGALNDEIMDAAKKDWNPYYRAVVKALPYIEVDSQFAHAPKLMPEIIDAQPTLSRSLGGSSLVPGGRKIPNAGRFKKMFKTTKFPSAPPVEGAPFPKGMAPSRAGTQEFTEEPGRYMDTNAAMDAVQELRKGATADFRAAAAKGGSKLRRKARDQQKAADELEALIERNLKANGDQKLYDEFVHARRQLAKIHSVQKAFSPKTGNVSSVKLAKDYKRLSGDLKKIARAHMNFPEAFGPGGRGVRWSPLEVGGTVAGGGIGALLGHPVEGGALGEASSFLGRLGAEKLSSSDLYQDALVNSMGSTRNALLPPAAMQTAILANRLMGLNQEE